MLMRDESSLIAGHEWMWDGALGSSSIWGAGGSGPAHPPTASPALKDDAAMSSLTTAIPQRAHSLADYGAPAINLISNYQ